MSARRVTVDVSGLSGNGPGYVGPRSWSSAHALARGLGSVPAWPHAPGALEAWTQLGVRLRRRGARPCVAGSPASMDALRAAVADSEEAPVWCPSPRAAALARERFPKAPWLVVEGPAWCDALAEDAVREGRAVAMAGEGTHEAPPGGAWLDDAVRGPLAPLGAAGAVLRAWLGLEAGELAVGARAMLERCAATSMLESPARALAVASRCAREAGARRTLHLVQEASSEAVARWAARAWGPGPVVLTGDEDALQDAHPAGETLFVLWEPGRGGDSEAATQLARREELPLLRVAFGALTGSTVGALLGLLAPVIAWEGRPSAPERWELARSRVQASVDASDSAG